MCIGIMMIAIFQNQILCRSGRRVNVHHSRHRTLVCRERNERTATLSIYLSIYLVLAFDLGYTISSTRAGGWMDGWFPVSERVSLCLDVAPGTPTQLIPQVRQERTCVGSQSLTRTKHSILNKCRSTRLSRCCGKWV